VVSGCAGVNLAFLRWALVTRPELNSDFRGPWSFARFAQHHAAQIYQAAPLQAFQGQLYPGFRSFFPYQYPPAFLLPIGWLSDFSFATAQTLWTLAGITVLAASAALFFGPSRRGFAILALLASPAALLNGAAGETGYFTAAFLLAGFALLPKQPWAAGIAFGLLTLKPQLGLLLPLVLLICGEFQAMTAACLTALALIARSCAAFPAGLWLEWLRALPVYQAQYLAAGKTLDLSPVVTIAGNLVALGAGPRLAWGLQAIGSGCCAIAVGLVCRRAPYDLCVAAVFAGMFICAPHAYAYDTLPLVAAMLILAPQSAAGIALCGVAYLAPYLLLTGAGGWFLYAIPETLLFTWIIYLAFGAAHRPNIGYEPVPAGDSRPTQF
jgi:hypothetical protein